MNHKKKKKLMQGTSKIKNFYSSKDTIKRMKR